MKPSSAGALASVEAVGAASQQKEYIHARQHVSMFTCPGSPALYLILLVLSGKTPHIYDDQTIGTQNDAHVLLRLLILHPRTW